MNVEKNRYEAINGIKAFACIGIVAMHVAANTDYQVKGFMLNQFLAALTNLVFLFMTISAFGMCCGYYEKVIDKKLDVASFYLKRYSKILPFFAVLCILDFLVSPSLGALYEVLANCTLFFGFMPDINISVIGVGWFLGVVFLFYLIFPFFCFILENKKRAWFAFFVSFVLNYLCWSYFKVGRRSMAFSFVFFMLGGLVYLYRDKVMQFAGKRWVFLIFALCATVLFFMLEYQIGAILLINLFLLAYAICVDGKSILTSRILKFIGGISFEVYLSHMLIFRVLEKAHLLSITRNDYVDYFITVLLVFIGTCIFSCVIKYFIDLFMRTFAKILAKL